jgi:glutamate-1-semialdehyde 2,1-aminomutase
VLSTNYARRTARSKKLYARARKIFAGGVNHNARFYEPYPIFVKRAKGQHIWDEDGNKYVDYWMGHMALILGHSPAVVVHALRTQLENGTHYGMGSRLSLELGEEVHRSVPCAEMLRFCNTGAEATMYLVRLARAYTGRKTVIKMAGGWHGYNTDLNMGVHRPFDRPEGEGILVDELAHVKTVRFNDLEDARKALGDAKGDVAAIFLEPVLGAGGCIPADMGYLRGLRELADQSGALLAFDEIVTGFRLAPGGAQERFGVKPDIAAFGKIVGGGMPIGLVCGLEEVVSMADPARKKHFVSIGGGTFSENPLSMAAGLATITYLRKNREIVYPQLEESGMRLRKEVDEAFEDTGVQAHTTGIGSLFMTHFGCRPASAEETVDEDRRVAVEYALHLMSNGVFFLPKHAGAISTCHSTADIGRVATLSKRFASALVTRERSLRNHW